MLVLYAGSCSDTDLSTGTSPGPPLELLQVTICQALPITRLQLQLLLLLLQLLQLQLQFLKVALTHMLYLIAICIIKRNA